MKNKGKNVDSGKNDKGKSCGKITGEIKTCDQSELKKFTKPMEPKKQQKGEVKDMGRFLVSFDWAIKRLLRSKANFPVIEGLLTVLFKESVEILEVIESESNQSRVDDKYNRVDIAVKDSKGNIIIVEIQSLRDQYFMKRLAYGTSKVITERMERVDRYEKVAKVISVAILFYKAGTDGADCIYGSNEFIDLRTGEKIELTEKQQNHYNVGTLTEVFPEYYLLIVDNFNNVAKSNLDEWLYFLKNEKIEDSFTAPGLKEAKEILDSSKLDDDDYRAYERYQDDRRRTVGEMEASFGDGIEKGRKERDIEIARKLLRKGMDVKIIADCTDLSEGEVESLRDQ